MNKSKNIIYLSVIALVAVIGVGFGVNAYVGNSAPKVVVEGNYIEAQSGGGEVLGAGNYPWHFGNLNIQGDLDIDGELRIGSGVTTQSSTTNETLTASQICDYNYLAYTPIQSMTLTLPATSTISSCLDLAGDSRSYVIENAATTTMNITIAAGAGMDLQEPDGQNVVIGQNNFAFLTFWKQSNGDVLVKVDETIPAD